jgi:DNA-binding IclR family transcriptional regulator
VAKALEVLEAFSSDTPELSLAELARKLDLPKTVGFRLLHTLEAYGFLQRVSRDGRYRIGPKAFQVGALFVAGNRLVQEADQILRELRDQTGCTSLLHVADGLATLVVAIAESTSLVRVVARLGSRLPLHVTASGKVLLAYEDEQALEKKLASLELSALTPRSITTLDELRAALVRVREQGFALSKDELALGMWAAAAPVRDHTNRVVAALAVAAPTGSLRIETDVLVEAVVSAAHRLSLRLGASERQSLGG